MMNIFDVKLLGKKLGKKVHQRVHQKVHQRRTINETNHTKL